VTVATNTPPAPATPPPQHAEALARAETAAREKRFGEADGICRDILRVSPGHVPALGLRGVIAALDGDVANAIPLLEQACAGDPNNAAWHSTLGEMYRMINQLDQALTMARHAMRLGPRQANHLVNLGKVHVDRSETDEGLTHFLAALSLEPENPNAHLGLGQVLLARGDFRPGWMEYEWRNKLEQAQGRFPPIRAPIWNGMRVDRGRILLIGDQGFGDTLQFARYIPMVAERCGEVLLGCAEDLLPLLGQFPGVGRVFNQWREIPSFTAYTLLSSLPYVFGTDLESIPSPGAYLHADAARVTAWRARLDDAGARGLRVGIFWAGRPAHPNNVRRSVNFAMLHGLARVPGVTLVSLQKDVPVAERAALAQSGVLDFSGALTDFGETAALVQNLDLVVTVDSAVAHLTGALGRPVWVLTPSPADWRWLLDRADSPWYASMRLFRQRQPGDWDGVMRDVTQALAALPGRG
jgi:tetratricopeptide (TPR) repeat protein